MSTQDHSRGASRRRSSGGRCARGGSLGTNREVPALSVDLIDVATEGNVINNGCWVPNAELVKIRTCLQLPRPCNRHCSKAKVSHRRSNGNVVFFPRTQREPEEAGG
jgi:hypothetical protein